MVMLYEMSAPEVPWGDYGRMLHDGMTGHPGRNESGRLRLERTGPYMPPITFPWGGDAEVVVTQSFRDAIEKSSLQGVTFLPVEKERIVRLEWHTWDRSADDPEQYPSGGEPESYVLDLPHCDTTAKEIGYLWELRIEKEVEEVETGELVMGFLPKYAARCDSLGGVDFFVGTDTSTKYVSEAAKQWIPPLNDRAGLLICQMPKEFGQSTRDPMTVPGWPGGL